MADKIRILVVEDDPQWRSALCDMYRSILGQGRCVVLGAATVQDARELLREQIHLLSLDINLGRGLRRDENGRIQSAYGGGLVGTASERGSCEAVIVITNAPHDKELPTVVPPGKDPAEVWMALHPDTAKHFPGRNVVLFKDPNKSIAENSEIFRRRLPANYLIQLSRSGRFPPPYTLAVSDQLLSRVTVTSGATKGRRMITGIDADFLIALALCAKEGHTLSHSAAMKICLQGHVHSMKRLHSFVNSFRRRLAHRQMGIDDKQLFYAVPREGWRLDESVRTVGAKTVSARGRGGQDTAFDRLSTDVDNDALDGFADDGN